GGVLADAASPAAGGRARAGAARRRLLGELAAGDRATLLRTGPRPAVLAGPVPPDAARAALAAWSPVQRRHDPAPALDLARELAGPDGEIVFATDTAPVAPAPDLSVVAFGEPRANAAILTAQRLPAADGGERLRLRLCSHGDLAATAFTVVLGEVPQPPREVVFADGVADAEVLLPAGAGDVRIELRADALAIDDVAWLLPAPDRTVDVCDLLPADERRRLALDRVFAAVGGVRHTADPRRAQLLVATRPGLLRPGQTEVLVAPGDGERAGWRGPFVVDRTHPLLQGVALAGVTWLGGTRELPGQVLVAAGAQALVADEPLDAGRRLWLNLDASAGNVVRAPDWPVLWSNLVEHARREVPGPEAGDVLLGEEARYRRALVAEGDDRELVLETPDGARRPLATDRLVGFVPEQPGVHRVLGSNDRLLARIAARFVDPAESDLRDLATGTWPEAPRIDADGPGLRDGTAERRWLALLLLLLVLADWWWLARRGA
ncbi:MAG: hypothetical protein JNL08_16430, partial [Planctomycetes bacterium]|nr:hypothetical protein [Planctomycetota bacterium]